MSLPLETPRVAMAAWQVTHPTPRSPGAAWGAWQRSQNERALASTRAVMARKRPLPEARACAEGAKDAPCAAWQEAQLSFERGAPGGGAPHAESAARPATSPLNPVQLGKWCFRNET